MPPSRNLLVGAGCVLFGLGMAAFPALAVMRQKKNGENLLPVRTIAMVSWAARCSLLSRAIPPHDDDRMKDGALSDSQIMRGNYMNSGGKDIGRDPDWDLKKGTYKGKPITGHSTR